jgi:hypothetical protein
MQLLFNFIQLKNSVHNVKKMASNPKKPQHFPNAKKSGKLQIFPENLFAIL